MKKQNRHSTKVRELQRKRAEKKSTKGKPTPKSEYRQRLRTLRKKTTDQLKGMEHNG